MATEERVVRHALLDFIDPDGVRRVALRGQKVRIDGDALKRAEELEALEPADFDPDGPEPDAAPAEGLEGPESSPPGAVPDEVLVPADNAAEQPPKAASKDAWVDFAVASGADRGEAEASSKQDLIDRFGG